MLRCCNVLWYCTMDTGPQIPDYIFNQLLRLVLYLHLILAGGLLHYTASHIYSFTPCLCLSTHTSSHTHTHRCTLSFSHIYSPSHSPPLTLTHSFTYTHSLTPTSPHAHTSPIPQVIRQCTGICRVRGPWVRPHRSVVETGHTWGRSEQYQLFQGT